MSLLNSFSFELPTKIEYGVGASGKLATTLEIIGASRILLVTDKGIGDCGLLPRIYDLLEQNRIEYETFDKVEANPKDYNVQAGVEKVDTYQADCLVAVGGGSPIDCAKAIGIVAAHGGVVRNYEGKGKITIDPIPMIAIPTTAGSGSEVTFSAVITDSRTKFKFSINDTKIAPRIALVDPEMTMTMPAELTAATGMDALTHAIEGYTAKVSEPLAEAAALYAIGLITNYLKKAFLDGKNLEARAGMLLGSILAAIAFSHSDVGSVHCIAEALGGKYDTPHGVCNAVVLPTVMEYNMPYCLEKYARVATAMGIAYDSVESGAQKAVEAIKNLAVEVKLPDFSSFHVKKKDFEELANNSVINGSNPNNPRPMSMADYLKIFETLSLPR